MDDSGSTRRVTLRDIAKQLGLSHATVSMALRDHPNVTAKTKERVQAEAKKSGYKPEPMLSALASYRQSKRAPVYHGGIAWLYDAPTLGALLSVPLFNKYYEGACQRASSLGYKIEPYNVNGLDIPLSRLAKIMVTRGVQGLLVAPMQWPDSHLEFNWEWFSCVSFGFSLIEPQLHLVSSTQYRIGITIVQKLHELGYRRVGFLSTEFFDIRTDRNFTAGFLVACRDLPNEERIQPLLLKKGNSHQETINLLREWVQQKRIDAIITPSGTHPYISQAGLKIPDDVAVALLGYQQDFPGYAGIDEQGHHSGMAAVDLVVGMIQRGERGIPEVPHRLLVEGKWIDGDSAPPVQPE